ncbi:hypothetical protein GCM10027416_13800 [Okibacterium endophyticum]
MMIRRAFRYWMFIASVALPIWPLIGWAVFGDSGWEFLGLIVAMPILFLALLAVSLLILARPEVRAGTGVSWPDVAVLTAWHVAVIGFGLFGASSSLFAVLGVVAGLAAFWLAIWELVRGAARRTRATFAEFERLAQQSPAGAPRRPDDGGEFIVIEEHPRRP